MQSLIMWKQVPEIAFTADTTIEFLEKDSPVLADALRARLLIIEMTFVDDSVTVDEVRPRLKSAL